MAKSPLLVDGTDIAQWADRREAQARLPQLMRRLISATMPAGIESIAFRADEGVALAGWDGLVTTSGSHAYVPLGNSAWEMGTDSAVKGKADDDYDKRTSDPGGVVRAKTTFVFVTPRRWTNKTKWRDEKIKQRKWKNVVVFDADDLATWLELAPGVALWFAALSGKHPGWAENLETFWDSWSSVTKPPIEASLLTSGRNTAVDFVKKWLATPAGALSIRGEVADEAIAFLAAALKQLPPSDRDRAYGRAVVVFEQHAWEVLSAQSEPLILIPKFPDRSRTSAATVNGHHVLLPVGRDEPSTSNTVDLPKIPINSAKESLKAMRLEARIDELVPLVRAGISALRRKLAILPQSVLPAWAAGDSLRDVVPALLAGRWHDENEGDQAAVAALAGMPYSEYRKLLEKWSRLADPPVRMIGALWTVVGKDDVWALAAPLITNEAIAALEKVALTVLGEEDPKFDLAPDERFYAALHEKVFHHSAGLREGIADALALMAATSNVFQLGASMNGEAVAERIVRKLLEKSDGWKVWASLSDQLRSLAEAAPKAFLNALERGLHAPSSEVAGVFHESDGFSSSSPHTGLLWALEVLAWSPNYLATAALCLATLARLDPYPESRLANRPPRTLREIFLMWHPSTSASLDRRLAVIDQILKRDPIPGWALLVALTPKGMDSASSTAKPTRRDWVPDGDVTVTRAEFFKGTQAILERMRSNVGVEGDRWIAVIDVLDDVPDSEYATIVDHLGRIPLDQFSDEDRLKIWGALGKQLSRHREFGNADWALPETKLSKIDALYTKFRPVKLLDQHAWLFGQGARLPRPGLSDWKKHEAALSDAQREAVEALFADSRLEGIIELAHVAKYPHAVGNALGRSSMPQQYEMPLLDHCLGSSDPALREVASAFLWSRRHLKREDWFVGLRQTPNWQGWSPEQKADYILTMPMRESTWQLLGAQDEETQHRYWVERSSVGLGDLAPDDVSFVANKFVKHGCMTKAIDFLAACYYLRRSDLQPELVAKVLEAARASQPDAVPPWPAVAHDTSQLLDFLDEAKAIDDERLSRLEWFYLPLVRHYRPASAMARNLARSPELFMELIKYMFRGENDEKTEASPDERARAQVAHTMLSQFTSLPGFDEEGNVDASTTTKWVEEVRKFAATADRVEVTDRRIGELFAHSPSGSDGAWPHEVVRELIETLKNDNFDQGLNLGLFNSRGVISRAIDEGGVQERELAARYRKYAETVKDHWPRTCRLLEEIAADYDSYAAHQDRQVEVDEEVWALRRPARRSGAAPSNTTSPSVNGSAPAGTGSNGAPPSTAASNAKPTTPSPKKKYAKKKAAKKKAAKKKAAKKKAAKPAKKKPAKKAAKPAKKRAAKPAKKKAAKPAKKKPS